MSETNSRWGATPAEWQHFQKIRVEDLLPCVANPNATISPKSSIAKVGKVPCRYNGGGMVSGFPEWTTIQSTDQDVIAWAKVADYGISLQTRNVRAVDVDIPDREQAKGVRDVIESMIPGLPVRYRADSGKFLVAFEMPGEYPKRKIDCEGGIIEFLANGQQFIAAGTHESGARYEWEGGLPTFPVVDEEMFEKLWGALDLIFGVGESTVGKLSVRVRGERIDMVDPVADYLNEHGLALGEKKDGSILVACPWEHEHSSGYAGDSSTIYFPAGTNGHAQGAFKCLHAHCTGRHTDEFLSEIGYAATVFEDLPPLPVASMPRPKFLYSDVKGKTDRILSTLDNLAKAVAYPPMVGAQVRYDEFRAEIMIAEDSDGLLWRPFKDTDYTQFRIRLERQNFERISSESIRDAVRLVAEENKFDTAIFWLSNLRWDGVRRIDRFLTDYCGAEDSPYVRAVSRYMWSAMAGRIMSPGIKADIVPILKGLQGIGKSYGLSLLVPGRDQFREINLDAKDQDLARAIRGALVIELGELRGLHTRDAETIKSFITKTHEFWVPKYQEFGLTYPRRCIFIGTTNDDEFLADTTGNRRWAPVEVTGIDVDRVEADRDQLWAEARVYFLANGVAYRDCENLAREVHGQYMRTHAFLDPIKDWLELNGIDGVKNRDAEYLRPTDILTSAIGLPVARINAGHLRDLRGVMQSLGYHREKRRWELGSAPTWAYVKNGTVPGTCQMVPDEKDGGLER